MQQVRVPGKVRRHDWHTIEGMEPRPLLTRIRLDRETLGSFLREKVTPTIPERTRAAHAGAIQELEILVGRDGGVMEVSPAVGRVPLPAELLEPVMEAVRQWRYRPVKLNGQPIEVVSRLEIEIKSAA